jgi:hypothetical protein
MQESPMRRAHLLAVATLLTALPLHADDGAASIAAGGIILMKREPHIVMAKEVLNISPKKILVSYEFRNDSDQDITTLVAFPVPSYGFEAAAESFGDAAFDDFQLRIEGKPQSFTTELRAFLGKKDITDLLIRNHIDIASFGHTDTKHGYDSPSKDLQRLDAASRRPLIAAGAFKDGEPSWAVEKKYYWTQVFPAQQSVHIEHSYSPVLGNSNTIGDPAIYQGKDAMPEYAQSCPAPTLRDPLSKIWNARGIQDESPLTISYVSFILTTANTWKTPIEDFTLIVERPNDPKYKTFVSFCWDGPVTQTDSDHFAAHANGLVPDKELMIGYINARTN